MKQAIGAYCVIKYRDEVFNRANYYFSFGEGLEETIDEDNGDILADHWGVPDENIFYFLSGESALKSLMESGVEDFTVISYELVMENENES